MYRTNALILDNTGEIDSFIVSPLAESGPANAGKFISLFVPGVHRLPVDLSSLPLPSSSCTSIETGKFRKWQLVGN